MKDTMKKMISTLALAGALGWVGSAWAWDGTVDVPNTAGGVTQVSCTGVSAQPSIIGNECVFIYTSTSGGTLTLPVQATVRYLVVGGGGSGGKAGTTGLAGKASSGGNAGSVQHNESQNLVAGQYTMTVGAGGAAKSSGMGGGSGNDGNASTFVGPSGSGVNITAPKGTGGEGPVSNGSSEAGTGNDYSSSITGTSVTYAQAGKASSSSSSGNAGETPGSGGQGAYNSGKSGAGADGIVVIRITSIASESESRTSSLNVARSAGEQTLTCDKKCSHKAASWSFQTAADANVAAVELINSTSTQKPQVKITPKGPGRTQFVAKNDNDSNTWTVTVTVTDADTPLSLGLKSMGEGSFKTVTAWIYGDDTSCAWTVSGVDTSVIKVEPTSGSGLEFSPLVTAKADSGSTSFKISSAYVTYTVNVEIIESGVQFFDFQGTTIKYSEGAGYDYALGDDHVLVITNTAEGANDGYHTVKLPSPYLFKADILAVGAGGSGGSQADFGQGGGGGGAGGFSLQENVKLTGISYAVKVGKHPDRIVYQGSIPGEQGGNSVILDADGVAVATAIGGGGGGSSSVRVGGGSGGSGGGGAWVDQEAMTGGLPYGIGGTGSDAQGHRGGTPDEINNGAAGGGAGSAGGAKSGEYGQGTNCNITGESVLYAQGGLGGRCDSKKAVADATGIGFGGNGGNGGIAGTGGDGIVIIRFKKAFTNTKIQYPTVDNGGLNHTSTSTNKTCEFLCDVSKLGKGEHSEDYTAFNQGAYVTDESGTKLSVTYANVVEAVGGVVTTNVSLSSDGSVTNGLCHHKFTVKLKEGYSWADGSAYGSSGTASIDWRITDNLGKIDATIRVDKEVEWDPNGSNATVKITSHSTPAQNPKIPKVLFLGTLCYVHGLEETTIKNSINATAVNADVDYHLWYSYDKSGLDEQYQGHVDQGKELPSSTSFSLKTSSHQSVRCFYNAIYEVLTDPDKGSDYYDYIILEFDGSRLGLEYCWKEEGSWSTSYSYRAPFEHEWEVVQYMKGLYANRRVIWIVDDQNVETGEVDGNYKLFPYYPSSDWVQYQAPSSDWENYSDYDKPSSSWLGAGRMSYNGLLGIIAPEHYIKDLSKNESVSYSYVNYPAETNNGLQVGYSVSSTVEEFLKTHVKPVAYNVTFSDKIKTQVGLDVTDFKVAIVTNGQDYADKADIPSDKWIRLYEAKIVDGKLSPTYEDTEMGINKNFSFEVVDNQVEVSLTNLTFDAWTRLTIGLVDDGTFKTSYQAEWNETTKQWEKNPNNGDAYVGMMDENGNPTEVYGEAATSVKWAFYAYPVQVTVLNGESYLNGHATNYLEFTEGYNPIVNYRGLPGYEIAGLQIDGVSQILDETNITQTIIENIQAKHDVYVGYTNFVGEIDGADASYVYDGQAHVPEIAMGAWAQSYTTKYTYAYGTDETYYDYAAFTNLYRTSLKDVAGSPYKVRWAVEVVQPGYGKNFLTPGFVKVFYGTNNVTITKKTLTVTAKYNYASGEETENQCIAACEKTFDQLKGSCGYTVSGFVAGEGIDDLTTKTIDYKSEGAKAYVPSTQGQFSITPYGFTSSNYDIRFVDGTLSVGKGTIVIDGVSQSAWLDPEKDDTGVDMITKIYDGLETQVVVNVTVPSDTTRYTIKYAIGNSTNRSEAAGLDWKEGEAGNPVYKNAGTNILWYAVESDSFFPVTNYTRVVIQKRPILLRSESKSWTFDNAEHSYNVVNVVVGDGYYDFLASEQFDVHTISYQQVVGSRPNLISCEPIASEKGKPWAQVWENNYDVHYEYGTLTVTPAVIRINGKDQPMDPEQRLKPKDSGVEEITKEYDGVGTNIVVKIDVPTGEYPLNILYATSNSTDPSDWKPFEEFSLTDVTDPDGQAVWYAIVDPAGNYVTVTNFQFVTITPKAATVTAKSASKVYDGTALTCAQFDPETTTGFVAGQGLASVTVTDASKVTNVADSPADNVIATIVPLEGTKLTNYAITTNKGSLAITPLAITLQSKNVGKVADGTPYVLQSADVFVAEGRFADGEGPFAYTAMPPLSTKVDKGFVSEGAKFEAADNGATKVSNYSISYAYGDLTLGGDHIYIGGVEQDPDQPKPSPGSPESGVPTCVYEYDGKGHGLEVNVTHPDSYKVHYSTDGENWTTDAILYTNVAYGAGGALVSNKVHYIVEADSIKYTCVTNYSWVVITPRKVTVTANEQKIAYGQALPDLTGREAFKLDREEVAGDAFTVPLAYEYAAEYVPGDYEISTNAEIAVTRSGASVTSCYDLTFVPGTLTVTQAVMTVAQPAEVEKQWDGTGTNITVTVGKGPASENQEISYSLDGGKTWTKTLDISEVGEYTVTFKVVDLTGKYADYIGTGKVTISRRVIRVTANNYTRQVNTSNPDPWPIEIRYLDTDSLMTTDDVSAIRGEIGVNLSYDEKVGVYENAAKPYRIAGVGYTIGEHYIVAQEAVDGEDGWVSGTLTITAETKILYTIKNYNGIVDGNGHTIRVKVTNDVSQVGTKDITVEWAWAKDGPWFATKTTVKRDKWADGIGDVEVFEKTSDGGKAVWFRITIDNTFTTETDYGYVILTEKGLKQVKIGDKGPFGPNQPEGPTDPRDTTDEKGTGVKNVVKTYDGAPTNVTVMVTDPSGCEPLFLQPNGTWTTTVPEFTDAGTNKVWYKVEASGYYVISNYAYVVIDPKKVTIKSGDGTYSYNGEAHSNASFTVTSGGFVGGQNVVGKDYATITAVNETGISNTFGYEAKEGTKLSNYNITQEYGTLKVLPGEMPDPDPKDPTHPKDPKAGPYPGPNLPEEVDPNPPVPTNKVDGTWSKLSDYDVVTNYDGVAHTFDVTALSNKLDGLDFKGNKYTLAYSLTGADTTWQENPFSFTDVTATSFWYRVAVPNYTNYIHAVGVTITQRVVTVSFVADSKVYDGKTDAVCSQTNFANVVSGESFSLAAGVNFNFDTPAVGTGKTVKASPFDAAHVVAGANTDKRNYAFAFIDEAKADITDNTFDFELVSYQGEYINQETNVTVRITDPKVAAEAIFSNSTDGVNWQLGNPSALTFKDVTNVTVYVKIVTTNYGTKEGSKKLIIEPRKIVFTCPTLTKPYDGTPLTFTANQMSIGGSRYAVGEEEGFTYEFSKQTAVGSTASTVTCTDSADGKVKVANYEISVNPDTKPMLTVTAKATDIGVASKSDRWPYDGNAHSAGYEVSNTNNLLVGDLLVVELEDTTITYPGVTNNAIKSVRIMRGEKDVTSQYANIHVTTGTLTVVNADFKDTEVTAPNVTKTYDGEPTNITVTVKNILASTAKVQYSDDGVNFDDVVRTKTDVGTYTIWYKVTAPYFNDYINSATIQIDTRRVTFTSPNSTAVYPNSVSTDTGHITVSDDGLADGETVTYTATKTITTVEESGAEATFDVSFTAPAKASNYTVDKKFGTLTIYPQNSLIITADSTDLTYTGVAQSYDHFSYQGELKDTSDEVEATCTGSITYPSQSPVANVISSYKVTRSGVDVTSEYNITCVPGELRMAKLKLDGLVSAQDIAKVYDAAETNITVNIAEKQLVEPAKTKITYRTSDGEPFITKNPTFKDYVNATVSYQVENPNYETFTGSAKVQIALRTVKLVSASASKTYDGTPLATNLVTIVAGDGLYDMAPGEFLTYKCTTSVSDITTKPVDNVFTYGVTNALGTAGLDKNYDFKPTYGTLEVKRAALAFKLEKFNGSYDGQEHGVLFDGTELPAGATTNYSVDAGATWTPKAPTYRDVTNVTVYVQVACDNYETVVASRTIEITPRELVLVPPDLMRAYNGEPLTFTNTDIKAGGQLYATGECFAYGNYASITEVGRVASTFTYADSEDGVTKVGNYKVTVEPNHWLEVLPDASKIVVRTGSYYGKYDGTAHDGKSVNLPLGYEIIDNGNLVQGDTVEVVLDGKTITEPGLVSNTIYSIAVKRGSVDVTKDYTNIVEVIGTLQVVNADFTDADVTATGVDAKYDGTEKKISVAVTNPLAMDWGVLYSTDGVTFTDVNPAFTNAGSATVTYVVTNAFFNPYTNSVSVNIAKRTVAFESQDDWKFRDGTPLTVTNIVQLTGGYDGFVAGEGLDETREDRGRVSKASITEQGSCEAKFEVVLSDKTLSSNYDIKTFFGTLYVYAADGLTLVAGSQEFTYDGANHDFHSYTVRNLDAGDRIDDAALTFVGEISHPDQSPVVNRILRESVKVLDVGGNDVTAKYGTFALIEGELTMRKLSIGDRVTAHDVVKVYDAEPTNIVVTVDKAGLPQAAQDSVTVHYSTLPNAGFGTVNKFYTKAGSFDVYYYVSASGCSDTAVKKATITIKTRPVKLVSEGATKAYDGKPLTNNMVTVTNETGYCQLAKGHGLQFNCTGSQTNAGDSDNTFDFAITNAANDVSLKDNYFVTFDYGKLVVTKASQKREDPANPPEGALTPYDYIGMYDGVARTIRPFTVTEPADAEIFYSTNGVDWVKDKFYKTDVCTLEKIWFKSVASNYVDVVTNGYVTITQRCVTVTSATDSFVYDGEAHSNASFTVTSKTDFVDGQGITCTDYATITTVAESGKPNTFGYDFNDGTKSTNYNITQEYGTLTMIPGEMPDPDPDPKDPANPRDPKVGPHAGPNLPEPTVPPVPTNKVDGTWSVLSGYDVVTNYDGVAHTFDVTALSNRLDGLDFKGNKYALAYSLTGVDTTWQEAPFSFTNVTATSFWYRVAVPNYTNYIHAVGVTITQRVATITFTAANKKFDTTTVATCTATNFENVVTEVGDAFAFDTTGITFAFDTKDVGVGKLVTASNVGDVRQRVIPLADTWTGNYAFVFVTTNYANITSKSADLTVKVVPEEFVWEAGVGQHPTTVVVTDGATTLTENVDYTVVNPLPTEVGKYTVTVSGIGNYEGGAGQTNFWITAHKVVTWLEDTCEGTNQVGTALSGENVFVDCPMREGYCLDAENSVTNGIVRRCDDPQGLLTLVVRYEKDANEDDVPDKYQRKITFRVVNGYWDNPLGAAPQVVWVTKFNDAGKWDVNGTGTLSGVPEVGQHPFGAGYTKGGAWWPTTPSEGMSVTNATSPLFLFGYNRTGSGASPWLDGTAMPPTFEAVADIATFAYEGGRAKFNLGERVFVNDKLVVSMPLEATQVTVQGATELKSGDQTEWHDVATKTTDADGYVTIDTHDYKFFKIDVR